jgi:hypothetical protein
MAREQRRTLDFLSATRIVNLPDGVGAQEPATVAQLNAAIEGINWKDSVRVSTQANLGLAAPGATIDGITMVSGDRFLARSQTAGAENGIYIWNGAATPATRSLDMNIAAEVEQATTTVEEGTNAGVTYRQSVVNVTLGTTTLTWTTFGSSAGAASETSAGIAELATQAETDAGTDDLRIVTPLKLATSVFASKKFNATVGDGSATSYVITHNLNTRNLTVVVYRATGNFDEVDAEVQHTTVNSITLIFDVAPTAAQFNCFIST